LGEFLLGGSAIPLHRFRIILRHASAIGVREGQIELSYSVILLGSFAIRLHPLGITCFRLGADIGRRLPVRLVLLSGQLKDSGTQQQQNREHNQPILFHIGKEAISARVT
jgi:hypothetical protein